MSDDDGEIVWAGGPDDLPEPIREFLQNMIGQRVLHRESHDGAEVVMPSSDQLTLGPGDLVVEALDGSTNDHMKQIFTCVALVDPEEHAEQFPDWETRVLNSHVLGWWYVPNNEPMLGWFPRYKLMRIEQWQFEALLDHNNGKKLDFPCPWLTEVFNNTVHGLATANPEVARPSPIPCGNCGKRTVQAVVRSTTERRYNANWFEVPTDKDPEGFYVDQLTAHVETTHVELRCLNCDAHVDVPLADEDVEETYNVYTE